MTGRPPGKIIRVPEGYSAHVPDPLPPRIEYGPALVRSLSDADRAIGSPTRTS